MTENPGDPDNDASNEPGPADSGDRPLDASDPLAPFEASRPGVIPSSPFLSPPPTPAAPPMSTYARPADDFDREPAAAAGSPEPAVPSPMPSRPDVPPVSPGAAPPMPGYGTGPASPFGGPGIPPPPVQAGGRALPPPPGGTLVTPAPIAPPPMPVLAPQRSTPGPAYLPQPLGTGYPAWITVEDRPLNRLSTCFRHALTLPLWLGVLLLTPAVLSMLAFARAGILFRRKYPVWAFSANAGFLAWHARVWAYALLLTDQFPSLSTEPGPVQSGFHVPEQGSSNRWNGFIWRTVMCIPHYIALGFLFVVVVPFVLFIAWFAILFTGRYPRPLFDFATGLLRWWFRVVAYTLQLAEPFPPYGFAEQPNEAGSTAKALSAIGGGFMAAAIAALFIGLAIQASHPYTETVGYDALAAGRPGPAIDWKTGSNWLTIRPLAVTDPATSLDVLTPARGERMIILDFEIRNRTQARTVVNGGAKLKVSYEDGTGNLVETSFEAQILTASNRSLPVSLLEYSRVTGHAVFLVPEDAEPLSFTLHIDTLQRDVRWEFD